MSPSLLLALLLGCGLPWNPNLGARYAPFPHPAGYAEDGAHAEDALDLAYCSGCHGVAEDDLVRSAVPAAPACNSCHVQPHSPDFRQGALHGNAWRDDPSKCSHCHGEQGALNPPGASDARCVDCHASYPHPQGWRQATAHGTAVTARATAAACMQCHGDGNDLPARVQCRACHATYPHPEGWDAPSEHGASYQQPLAGDVGCGSVCHQSSSAPGDTPCASCHDLFPHPSDWTRLHSAKAQARGLGACEGCHDTPPQGSPTLPVPCDTACHRPRP